MTAAATGIELRRHDCISTEQWDVMRPKLKEAATMAVDVAHEYGIHLEDTKYAYFHAVGPRYPGFGEARTTKTSHWFFGPGMVKGRIDVGFIASRMIHELVHLVREEAVITDTVGSLAATEGAAYNIDFLSRKDGHLTTWKYHHPGIMQLVAGISKKAIASLYDELGQDMYKPIYDDDMLRKWWHTKRELGVRMIDVVGIAAVRAQIDQGYSASEVWRLPTLDVLGYEAIQDSAA